MKKIAVVVGHNSKDQGANAVSPINRSEFDFNGEVADLMVATAASNNEIELLKVNREDRGSFALEIDEAYQKADAFGADVSVELHFNANGPMANGTETLTSGSTLSRKLADVFQAKMLSTLELKDRRVKTPTSGQAGFRNLRAGAAPAILTEPFFGSNSSDCEVADSLGPNGFAQMYLEAIQEYFDLDSVPPAPVFAAQGAQDEFLVAVDLLAGNRNKEQFLEDNRASLQMIVDAANGRVAAGNHGQEIMPLTLRDVFGVFYAEMGLKDSGAVDPNHTHSLEERGLLPLPSNIRFWNGGDSPSNTQLTTLERNVKEFTLYLANLKNRDVFRTFGPGKGLYIDLFTHDGVKNSERAQMDVVAAVVHGNFIDEKWAGDPAYIGLIDTLAESGNDPDAVVNFLEENGFLRAQSSDGRSIIRNRIGNLNEGESLL